MKTILCLSVFLALAPQARASGEGKGEAPDLRAAGRALVEGDLEKAESLYLAALQSPALAKKQQASVHHNLGSLYMSARNPEKAIVHFDLAISLLPDFAEAHYGRGNYHTSQKDYRAAIADYTRAIALKPAYQQAYNNRGMCWDRLGEYEQAYQDYTRAIEASGGSYPKAEINRELVAIKRRVTSGHELSL